MNRPDQMLSVLSFNPLNTGVTLPEDKLNTLLKYIEHLEDRQEMFVNFLDDKINPVLQTLEDRMQEKRATDVLNGFCKSWIDALESVQVDEYENVQERLKNLNFTIPRMWD